MTLASLSWTVRADLVWMFGALAVLALAPRLEKSGWATAIIGLLSTGAAIACGLQDKGLDRFAVVGAGFIAAFALVLLQSSEMNDDKNRPEATALLLMGAVGGVVLARGGSLLEIAVGVELLSLVGASLVALGKGPRALEGAFKYFVLTAITFAVLLFGMALVFVGTGSIGIPSSASTALVSAGLALFAVGLAFKLAVAPVHFGALDAYTAGPANFVGYVMVISKLGAGLALMRIAQAADASVSDSLVGVGIVSLAVGVAAGYAQTDLRRLLAYSAVAHAGFIALAAATGRTGEMALHTYVVGYGATALLAFAALAGTGGNTLRIGAMEGAIGRTRSFALLLALLSLAGVPPFPGFFAKLAVLDALWRTYGFGATALASLGGVLGIIYYLKPMPALLANLRAPHNGKPREGAAPALGNAEIVLVGILIGAVVVFGLFPYSATSWFK